MPFIVPDDPDDNGWDLVLDTQQHSSEPSNRKLKSGETYSLAGRTIAMLCATRRTLNENNVVSRLRDAITGLVRSTGVASGSTAAT